MFPPSSKRKTRSRALAALLPVVGFSAGSPAAATAPSAVRLRNDLSAGMRSVYSMTIRTTRSTEESDEQAQEVLVYEQHGQLTLLGLTPPEQGRADRAWMLELDTAWAERLTRGGQEVTPLPEPVELGLPPRAVQLRVDKASPLDAYAWVVGGSPLEQAALQLALDVVHWPKDKVAAAEQWTFQMDQEHFSGERTFTLTEIRGKGLQREAVITSTPSVEFRGKLQGVANLERAQCECVWQLEEKSLLTLESQVELSYQPQRDQRNLVLELTLKRLDRRRLPPEERQLVADELAELTPSIESYLSGDRSAAVDALGKFESEHPRSMWLPVARDLLAKAKYEANTLATLDEEQLGNVLEQLFVRWQSIAITDSPERLQPLRTTFGELVRTRRDGLRSLTTSEDANLRAMAVFCFAFGRQEDDLKVLTEAADDSSSLVRAWAVYGLAERGDPDTDSTLLTDALADTDPRVRQRACMAIKACVKPGSPRQARFATLLIDMLASESDKHVRMFAAATLGGLAGPSDLGRIQRVRLAEQESDVRALLDRIIRDLEHTPDGNGG